MNRRTLFKRLATGTGLVVAGLTGIPAFLLAISPAIRRRGETWKPVGQLDNFPLGEVRRGVVEVPRNDWVESLSEKAVYVWRKSEQEIVVYSRNCTDLSCPVRWDPASERFFCPCHGGIFAQDGTAVAGPPREPLWRYHARIRDGQVEIDLDSLPPMT